ncbi:MAG: hypothetical protein K1X64_02715 [Myxococcaceae bacterium]|nr:hypothetical protein [Myxococcaceae bacterium]
MVDDRFRLTRSTPLREVDKTEKPTLKAEVFSRPSASEVAEVKESLLRDLPPKEAPKEAPRTLLNPSARELPKPAPAPAPEKPRAPERPAESPLRNRDVSPPPRGEERRITREEIRELRHAYREARREERREMRHAIREMIRVFRAENGEGRMLRGDSPMTRATEPSGDGHLAHGEEHHQAEGGGRTRRGEGLRAEGHPEEAPSRQMHTDTPLARGNAMREGLMKAAEQTEQHGHPSEAAAHQEGAAHGEGARAPNTPLSKAPTQSPTKGEGTAAQGKGGEAQAQTPEAGQTLTGPPPKPVSKLVPDLKKMTQAEEVPNRFLKDVVAARSPLLEGNLPKEQRASRLFGFFSHYAERFVALAKGVPEAQNWGPATEQRAQVAQPPTGPQLPKAQKDTAVEQFLSNLKEVGFTQLKDRATGNTGLQTAKQMLEAETPRDVQRQARETALVVVGGSTASQLGDSPLGKPQFNPDGTLINGRQVNVPNDWDEEMQRRRRQREHKVLGSNMLWNILHLDRRPDETMTKDELNRLAFGAILVLVGVTLMVVVLVNL